MDQQVEPVGEAWKYDQDYHRMADFLGLSVYDRQDYRTAQKVKALKTLAGERTGKEDVTTVLTEVAKLQKTIGYHGVGKELINQLYQNMRINQDTQRIRKEQAQIKVEKPAQKNTPIQKVVSASVNQVVGKTINEMVKKALTDKRVIQGAVESSMAQALKGMK